MLAVPEKVIKEAAEVMSKEESNNTFSQALAIGEQFRINGLSPIYILDKTDMTIYVTSMQKLQKKLN